MGGKEAMGELVTSHDFIHLRGRRRAGGKEGGRAGSVEEVPFLDRCESPACGRRTCPRPRGCFDLGRPRPPPPPLCVCMQDGFA